MNVRRSWLAATAIAVLGIAGLAWGAVSDHSTKQPTALTISAAYIREPASPDVVAVYLRIDNKTGSPDEITSVTTGAGGTAMTMSDNAKGGMDMAAVRIPAHGSVTLKPFGQHIMIQKPSKALVKGNTVVVTVHFRVAHPITVTVPVIGITDPLPK